MFPDAQAEIKCRRSAERCGMEFEMPLLFLHPQRKRRQSNISRLWDIGELEDTIERQGGENRDHKNPGGRN